MSELLNHAITVGDVLVVSGVVIALALAFTAVATWRLWGMKRLALIALCGLLSGCQTTSSVTTVAVCSVIQSWTKEEQARLRTEIVRGIGPMTQRMSAEWVSLRDQARACLAKKRL